jgi:Asp-tRNA(Asn)/Glu-tRNA(Gln) amidotransferase A subunit family amidase
MISPLSPTFASASEIARAVHERVISAEEVVRTFLDRIDRVNPRVNAIATLAVDQAVRDARAVDARLAANGEAGPLAGVPFTVKDIIAVAGLRTTAGSLLLEHFVPEATAPAIARLQQAGAILLGKSNCPEFALDLHTSNRVFGGTWNPWNLAYTSGGSSGGDSAAVAAGCAAFGIGTDYGGSIRWPAHCTGLLSLRPTPGRVPTTGQLPYTSPGVLPPPNSMSLQSQLQMISPIARSVDDLALLLEVMSGVDDRDPFAVPVELADWKQVPVKELGCAWFESEGTYPVRPEVAAVVADAAGCLRTAGLRTTHLCPPGLERAEPIFRAFRAADGMPDHMALAEGRTDLLTSYVRDWLGTTRESTVAQYRALAAERDALRADILEFMREWPILLLPVACVPAFRPGSEGDTFVIDGCAVPRLQIITCCRSISLLGLPAAVVPFGTSGDGLPIAVQIVGRPFADQDVLAVAALLETAYGAWHAPGMAQPLIRLIPALGRNGGA